MFTKNISHILKTPNQSFPNTICRGKKQQQNPDSPKKTVQTIYGSKINKCTQGPKALSSVTRHLSENLRCMHIKDCTTKMLSTFKFDISLNKAIQSLSNHAKRAEDYNVTKYFSPHAIERHSPTYLTHTYSSQVHCPC